MEIRRFRNSTELTARLVDLLGEYFEKPGADPQGIMLSGGNTPQSAYTFLALNPVPVTSEKVLFFSDERMAPFDSANSNFGKAQPMFRSLGLSDRQLIRVRTDLGLEEAADHYDRDLAQLLEKGTIPLGLLGLGSDGHAASLFSPEDIERGRRRYAIAVHRPNEIDRVSVTARLIQQIERVVFVVKGPEKREIVETLVSTPESIPAGLAVKVARKVEVWYA